jgi:CubicO group peptidase (beta-lactamase class C family)
MNKKFKIGCLTFFVVIFATSTIFAGYLYFELKVDDAKYIQKNTFLNKPFTDSLYIISKNIRNKSQIAFGVYRNDSLYTFGLKRENDSLLFVENRYSLFGIGSISKTFTATLLTQMHIDKELDMNDDLSLYTGIKMPNKIKISLKQLANHTSGLPRIAKKSSFFEDDNGQPYLKYDEKWLNQFLEKEMELEYPQNEISNYSNLGAGILGHILAKQHKTSYENLVQKQLFDLLNMNNSSADYNKVKSKLVASYTIEGTPASIWQFKSPTIGAGGIFSNVEDMIKWAKIQMDTTQKAFQMTHIPSANTSKGSKIGLGWHLVTKNNKNYLFHNGQIGIDGGYSSSMLVDTKNKIAIVILSNIADITNMGFVDKLAFLVERHL